MSNINVAIANLYVTKKVKDSYFNCSILEESKNISSDFLEVVKNSPILQLEYKVYNNIESKHIDNDLTAGKYIDNNIKLFEVFTLKEIEAEHKKLEKFVKNTKINEDRYDLYTNIGVLINESLLDYKDVNVDNIHESFTYVLNYLKEPKPEPIDSNLINENVIEIAINKFNEKYESLNEDDKSLLKKILKSNLAEKENIFDNIKKENLLILETVNKGEISEVTETKLSSTIKRISEMKFNKKTVDDDIIHLHEFKKRLL